MRALAVLLVLSSLLLGACGDEAPAPPRWTHDVELIETLPRDHPVHFWWEDGEVHAAFVAKTDDGVALVIDASPWPSVPAMPVTWDNPGTDVSAPGSGPDPRRVRQ